MIEIFRRGGILQAAERQTAPLREPQYAPITQDQYNKSFILSTGMPTPQKRMKRTLKDLLALAESPLPARAIRLIRNGIRRTKWGVQPIIVPDEKEEQSKYDESVKRVRDVLEHPNLTDRTFGSFLGQIIEDMITFDAGVWEYVEKPSGVAKNEVLALEVVPGYSISPNLLWKGDPNIPRWGQQLGALQKPLPLLDRQIEYIMMRKRSTSMFGLAPLEATIDMMDAWLGVSDMQRLVASNRYPGIMVWLGEDADQDQITTFRAYWENDLRGKGVPGFLGGFGKEKPQVIDTKPPDDSGLFLQYQEALVRVLAYCFDLSAMDFNLERDVNRATSETLASSSVLQAIVPYAEVLAETINIGVLPRIAEIVGDPLITELAFFWIGLESKDKKRDAEIHQIYYNCNALSIDEIRSEIDWDPLPNGVGKLTKTPFETLMGQDPEALIRDPNAAPPEAPANPTVPPEEGSSEETPPAEGVPSALSKFPFREALAS